LDASDAKGDKASDQNLQTTPSEKSQDSKKVESKFPNNWYRSHFFNSFEKLIKNTKQ
jgi:hypothetical protein